MSNHPPYLRFVQPLSHSNFHFWILQGVVMMTKVLWTNVRPMRWWSPIWGRKLRRGMQSWGSWRLGREFKLISLIWPSSFWRSRRRRLRHWRRSLQTRRQRSRRQCVTSVRLRRKRCESIVTPMPSWRSLGAPLLMVLMTAFVKSKPLSLTWIFLTCPLMPKLRLLHSLFTSKEQTSSSPMRPTPILKVTGMQFRVTKRNPLRTWLITLKGIEPWRRKLRIPLLPSCSFFSFLLVNS